METNNIYDEGKVENKYTTVNGKLEGEEISYYASGKIKINIPVSTVKSMVKKFHTMRMGK